MWVCVMMVCVEGLGCMYVCILIVEKAGSLRDAALYC